MGSRGTFDPSMGKSGGIQIEQREFSTIGYLNNVKIIQCDTKSNSPTTTYSNTANTVYYGYSKEQHCIEHIYYYKNHRLVKSVDFKEGETPHTHYWNNKNGVVGRTRHDQRNHRGLTERDTRLMNKAKEYNNTHNG